MDPPKSIKELEYFLTTTLRKSIDRSSISLGSALGKGEFGEVTEGIVKSLCISGVECTNVKVAVKQLKRKSEDQRLLFLKESSIMGPYLFSLFYLYYSNKYI